MASDINNFSAISICQGVREGKRLVCKELVTDSEIKKDVMKFLSETLNRIEKWKVHNTWWIDELYIKNIEEFRKKLKNIEDKYPEKIINNVKTIVESLLNYIYINLRSYWENKISLEIEKIIERIRNGKVEVVVNKTEKTLMIHIYEDNVELKINKIYNSNSVIIQLVLNGMKGFSINIPNVFNELLNKEEYEKFIKEVLIPMEGGFAMTDEGINKNKPSMKTSRLWQVLLWSLIYPGEIYIIIDTINVNKSGESIIYHLRANSHTSFKQKVPEMIRSFDDTAFLNFLLTVILGDGDIVIRRRKEGYTSFEIRITAGGEKINALRSILERFDSMKIRYSLGRQKGGIKIIIESNYAIELSRKIINVLPPIMKALLDLLETFGLNKWSKLKRIANAKLAFKPGNSQVNILSIGFTISITPSAI